MDREQTKAKFAESKSLYRAGQYEESLGILEELNRIYPITKNVLFPMALNLRALKRYDEALAICEEVILNFDAEKAHKLRSQLEQDILASSDSGLLDSSLSSDLLDVSNMPEVTDVPDIANVPNFGKPDDEPVGGLDLESLNAEFDEPIGSTKPVITDSGGVVPWGKVLTVGLCVVGIVFVGSIVAFIASGTADTGGTQDGAPASDEVSLFFTLLVWTVVLGMAWVVQVVLCFFTLMFTQSMPEHTLGANLTNIGKTAFIMVLLGLIPVVGGIAALVFFISAYDLGIGGCFVYAIVSAVVVFLIAAAIFAFMLLVGITIEGLSTEPGILMILNYAPG